MINVNEYFDGMVKSLGCRNAEGELTVGVMEVGNYTFFTSKKEVMTVVSGELKVLLPGETKEQTVSKDQTFTVSANEKFQVTVIESTIYICKYQ